MTGVAVSVHFSCRPSHAGPVHQLFCRIHTVFLDPVSVSQIGKVVGNLHSLFAFTLELQGWITSAIIVEIVT